MITILISFTGILLNNYWISNKAKPYLYNSVSNIPANKVGLLLGTGKFLTNGSINLYYKYRIDAAAKLFKAGKIDIILVSGDNSRKDYDEPTMFKQDLIASGIPEEKIHLDYAGFRTLDSVLRARDVFGLNAFTIISQQFHNERAIFLAQSHGINAIAFNAKNVNGRYGIKTKLREYLARVKSSIDLLFNVQPKIFRSKI
ncbi:SanA/YdcF family protein [Aestuariibaculum suncheonense]|nr:ElyC/SanA/YdcF family protein [Aestuariibaculum suncheonense]